MLTATGLFKSHGTRVLFRDVNVTLLAGRRAALVGGNGTGKTTLLEILVGQAPPDGGDIHRAKDLRIGYLPQEGLDVPDGTVLDTVVRGAEHVAALADELRRLEHLLAHTTGAEHDRAMEAYGDAQSHFEQLGGYGLEADAHRVLAGLGFDPDDAGRAVRELSGGWRMRVALARLLVGRPDLLVLDEPTNHLDVDSVAWLEDHLAGWRGALLFVSHDRDFIDNTANRVMELAAGTVNEYVGGFAEFVVEREERMARLRSAAANQARQVAQTERFIERFRYKATKSRQVQSRVKGLERLDRIEVPDERELKARFQFPAPPRGPRVVAELEGVSAGYDGKPVLRDVSLVVERGERVALVGPNGAGKSTLLKLLLGELSPMSGHCAVGANVVPAAFAQHQADVLDPDKTVLAVFKAGVPEAPGRNLRTLLGSFGFPGDAAERLVGELSGGERTRLALGRIMVEPANLLVLDEPTNHLDLASCDILEDALRAWPGTVLLVTHDRYLIRSVSTALIEVRHGSARRHAGVDEAILGPGGAGVVPSASPPAAPAAGRPAPTVTGGSPSRPVEARGTRKRVEADRRNRAHRATKGLRDGVKRAERRWERAEAEVAELQRQLADPALYERPDDVQDVARRHHAAKEEAAIAMAEWESATLELETTEARLDAEAP